MTSVLQQFLAVSRKEIGMFRTGRRIMGIGLAMGICSFGFIGSPARADEGSQKDAGHYVKLLDRKLKLTDEQRAQVESIIQDHQARMQPLKEQMAALREDKRSKIKAVLTPEQQEKFVRMDEQKMKRRRGWFHGDQKQRKEGSE